MRLYSKAYAGKQVNWRDSNGDTWVLYPDPITGEVFYIASTGQSVDGYDTPFKVVTVQGVDGVPIRRVYISPTDPGQIGATVQFDFKVT